MIIKGGTIRVKIGTKTIFHATEAKFSTSKKESEIETKDSGGIITAIDDGPWSITGSMVLFDEGDEGATQMSSGDMIDAYDASALVAVEFTAVKSGNWLISGNAYVTQYDIDASQGNYATLNYTLKGEGNYTKSDIV